MIALYVGIYRIALGLHRRSVAQRERSIACLVSMAGGAVTQIGSAIGMNRAADGHAPSPPPANTPDATDTKRRQHHDDDDDDDDDDTPHIASRLPSLLIPATSFALLGRLTASRHQAPHKQATTATSVPQSSSDVGSHRRQQQPVCAAARNEPSPLKSVSTVPTCSENSSRAADFGDEQASAPRRMKLDAASAVAAKPEDLHDLPFFEDDDDDIRRLEETKIAVDDGRKFGGFAAAADSLLSSSASENEQRVVRFNAATDDVTMVSRCARKESDAPPGTSCNGGGGRPAAAQSSSSTSSSHFHHHHQQQQQQQHKHTDGFVGHVWRHMVVHKEGRHVETRLEKSPEPDERQALLRASCPRHGGKQLHRLPLISIGAIQKLRYTREVDG